MLIIKKFFFLGLHRQKRNQIYKIVTKLTTFSVFTREFRWQMFSRTKNPVLLQNVLSRFLCHNV